MTPHWRKSSRSGSTVDQSECVEVAKLPRNIAVRDSKNPTAPHLTFATPDWHTFTCRIKTGEHDLT
jgi:uncharacterized protein DUF397